MFCSHKQLHLHSDINIPNNTWWKLFMAEEKYPNFQNNCPVLYHCLRETRRTLELSKQPTKEVFNWQAGTYKKKMEEEWQLSWFERGSPLLFWAGQANRQKAMGCYLGGTGPRVRGDSMSRANQNATDQVTGPVNIADAYDLCRSLNTQWNSNLLLKD